MIKNSRIPSFASSSSESESFRFGSVEQTQLHSLANWHDLTDFSQQHLTNSVTLIQGQSVGSHEMISAEREPITGVRACSGVQGRSLGPGPLKLNAFLHYHNLRSRHICPKIVFCRTKKFVGRLMGMVPFPLDPTVDADILTLLSHKCVCLSLSQRIEKQMLEY